MQTQTFPPQAYSKETISEAFMWLQSQPDEVKKQATHTEALLSLYLKNKSQKYWAAKTNTSINNSTNNFNDQLQEIAMEVSSDPNQPYSNRHTPITEPDFNKPLSHTLNDSDPSTTFNVINKKEEPCIPDIKQDLEQILDTKSLNSLHTTKAKLNLSSNKEAARLLISLGFEQVKSLIPDTSTQSNLENY